MTHHNIDRVVLRIDSLEMAALASLIPGNIPTVNRPMFYRCICMWLLINLLVKKINMALFGCRQLPKDPSNLWRKARKGMERDSLCFIPGRIPSPPVTGCIFVSRIQGFIYAHPRRHSYRAFVEYV
jgi:hypothetical protein